MSGVGVGFDWGIVLCALDEVDEDGDVEEAGELEGAGVLFCGHTHRYELAREGGLTRVNPGHMKCGVHKERIATCALVRADPGGIDARVFSVETGEPVMRKTFE